MLIKNKKILYIIIAGFALLAAVSLVQGIHNGKNDSQDFQWDAAKAFALRINPYDVSLEQGGMMPGYEFDRYYLQMEANQFPSLLMILLPMTVFKPLTARYVWLALNLVFTVLMLYLLKVTFFKDIDNQVYIILSLLMIAGTPYRNHLGVGQHTVFSYCMFLAAVYFSEFAGRSEKDNSVIDKPEIEPLTKKNSILTCVFLFLCYFKYTLTAPLALYFVYKKRYKELIISISAHAVLTFVAAWWLHDSFLNMIIKPLKVSSALLSEGGLDISALLHGSKLAYVFALLIMAGLLVITFKMPAGCDNTLISLLILWSLIITYHRTYDFFVIITVASLFPELSELPTRPESPSDATRTKFIVNITGLQIVYGIVLFLVFFFLRIFSENTFSKYITGGIYYIFTIIVTYISIYIIKKQSKSGAALT